MIEIIIITHGIFGEELTKSSQMILGQYGHTHNISVLPESSITMIAEKLDKIIDDVNGKSKGILILTDMFGGSPSNVAFSYAAEKNVEIVSGVNLPMLLKALSGRMAGLDLVTLVTECGEAGRSSIKVATEIIQKKSL